MPTYFRSCVSFIVDVATESLLVQMANCFCLMLAESEEDIGWKYEETLESIACG